VEAVLDIAARGDLGHVLELYAAPAR
jgi:hypothetical protein